MEVRFQLQPKDARAIAFECKLTTTWKVLGYHVLHALHEVLDPVHHATDKQHSNLS